MLVQTIMWKQNTWNMAGKSWNFITMNISVVWSKWMMAFTGVIVIKYAINGGQLVLRKVPFFSNAKLFTIFNDTSYLLSK